jgi:regulator of ribosome biosynthesis
LPTAKVDNEIVIKLPPGTTRLPRAKPVPKAKELTKWEKYAKEKGITKRKKANAEWDEELNVIQMKMFYSFKFFLKTLLCVF